MSGGIESRLHTAVWAYHNAVQRRDGVELRLRRGDHDPELLERSLTAAEGVVHARVELYRLLMADGWIPPRAVATDMVYDDTLLHEPSGQLD